MKNSDSFPILPFHQNWTLSQTIFLETTDRKPNETCHSGLVAFQEAVGSHIMWLAASGKIKPIPHVENRQVGWADLWNHVARQEPLPDYFQGNSRFIAQKLGNAFYKVFFNAMGQTRDDLKAGHERVIKDIEEGTFHCYRMSEQYSHQSGENLYISLEGWAPQLNRFDSKDPDRFRPLTEGAACTKIEHVEVSIPSGELLIADWIRISELTDLTKLWEGEGDINSSGGRVSFTKNYAQHGLISVCVGNSCPAVVSQDGRLIVGCLDGDAEDQPTGQVLKSICTDLRWATMIDRQVLVDTLAHVMGQDSAEEKVTQYEEENKGDFQKVQVNPGTYHLYFAPDTRTFSEKFKCDAVDTRGFDCPMLVLSGDALTLEPVADVGAAPSVDTSTKRPPRMR